MTGFDLPNNYTANPKALLRKKRSCATSSSATPPTSELVTPTPSATPIMAKTLRDYSVPTVANLPIRLAINTGNRNFELCTSLIMMVMANQLVCQVRMRTRISNTSSSCVTPSSSTTSRLRASSSACFTSPSRRRQSNSFTRKMKLSRHGTNVPRRSSSCSSPWAKPMP